MEVTVKRNYIGGSDLAASSHKNYHILTPSPAYLLTLLSIQTGKEKVMHMGGLYPVVRQQNTEDKVHNIFFNTHLQASP